MTTRIAGWSGPRNISTALMRSWDSRADTTVIDEPFYAYWLDRTGAPHPLGRPHELPPAEFAETAELILTVGVKAVLEQSQANLDFVRSEQGLGIGWQHPEGLSDQSVRAFVEPILQRSDGPETLERWMREFNGEVLAASESALRSLEAPALIAWGTDDPLFPLEWAYWLRDTLPGARNVVEVDGGKLYFPQERPQALIAPLRDLWSQTPSEQPATVAGAADGAAS